MKVPPSWSIETLEDCVDKFIDYRGKSPNKTDNGILLITAKTVRNGYLDFSDPEYISVGEFDSWMSRGMPMPGDILFTTEAPLGNVAEFPSKGRYALAQRIITLRGKNGVLDNRFLKQYLLSSSGQRQVDLRSTGSTAKGIKQSTLRTVPIKRPPLLEQQKIADILGTWDEALEKLDALIAAKARRKQALMQQLLTGYRRLPGFSKPWKRVELSDVAEECSIRNGQKLERTRLYAVTKAEGMVPMRENVQGATVNRCQIVERGWFAYNPMRINIGSIARWEGNDPVMVSPDYVVFRTKESLLLSDYLNHIRRGDAWTDFVGTAGNGSVRVRIWFDDLGYFEFPLPPIEEQRAIATVLDEANAELQLLHQQRTALDQQKRGLMQRLLTGKIRVRIYQS
jgi:type I restriction enzyme, S subunit